MAQNISAALTGVGVVRVTTRWKRSSGVTWWDGAAAFSGAGDYHHHIGIIDSAPEPLIGTGVLSGDAAQRHWLSASGAFSGVGTLGPTSYQAYGTNPAFFAAADSTFSSASYQAYSTNPASFSAAGAFSSLTSQAYATNSASFAGADRALSGDTAQTHQSGPGGPNPWPGTAGFRGDGTLYGDWFRTNWPDSAAFAGRGSWLISPTGVVDYNSPIFAGVGTFVATASVRHWINASAAFAGVGTLQNVTYQAYGVNPAVFSGGDSALDAIIYQAYAVSPAFSAVGTLIPTPDYALPISGALAAIGTLAGDAAAVHEWQATGSFSAAGSLTSISTALLPGRTIFAGLGGVSATSVQAYASAAALQGIGVLNGDAFVLSSGNLYQESGYLSANGQIAASDTLLLPTAGSFATNGILSAFVRQGLAAAGPFLAGGMLAGTAQQLLRATAVFIPAGAITAVGAVTLPTSGAVSAIGAMSAAAALGLPSSASISATGQLSTTSLGAYSVGGAFSGTATVVGSVFGISFVAAQFSGTASANSFFFSPDAPPQHWDDVHVNRNLSGGGALGSLVMNGIDIFAPAYGNEGFTAGKKYWEVTVTANNNEGIGLGNINSSSVDGQWLGVGPDTLGIYLTGNPGNMQIWVNDFVQAAATVSWSYGDLFALAADFDNNLFWIRDVTANSPWYGTDVGDPSTGLNGFSLLQSGFTITAAPRVPAVSLYYNRDTAVGYFAPLEWSGTPPAGFDAFDYEFAAGSFQAVGGFAATGYAVHEWAGSGLFSASGVFSSAISQFLVGVAPAFAAAGSLSAVNLALFVDSATLSAVGQFSALTTFTHADPRFVYGGFSGGGAAALHIGIVDQAPEPFMASGALAGVAVFIHPTTYASFTGTGTFHAAPTVPPVQVSFGGGGALSMPKPVLELIVTPSAPSLTNPAFGAHVAYLNGQRWDGRAFDGNFIFTPPHWDYPNAGIVGGCGAGVFSIVQPDGPGSQAELIINPAGPGPGSISGTITDFATIEAADPPVSQVQAFAGGANLAGDATVLRYGGNLYPESASFRGVSTLAAAATQAGLISGSFAASANLIVVDALAGVNSGSFAAVGSLVARDVAALPASAIFDVTTGPALVGTATLTLAPSAGFAAAANLSGSLSSAALAAVAAFPGYTEIDAQTAQWYYANPGSFAAHAEIDGQTAQWYYTNSATFAATGSLGATPFVVGNFIYASFIDDSWFAAPANLTLPTFAAFSASAAFAASEQVATTGFAAFSATTEIDATVAGGVLPAAVSLTAVGALSGVSAVFLPTSAAFAAVGNLRARATFANAGAATFAGRGTLSERPTLAANTSAIFSGSGVLYGDTLPVISGQYWPGQAAFAGAGGLSATANIIYRSSPVGFAGTGGLAGQLFPILDLTDIGATQTSPISVHSFIYTGINVTIDQNETGVLVLALDFDPLPPPADLREIAYQSLGIPEPTFDGLTAVWDYGGTNQVMTQVQSIPSPATPSPPGLGNYTVAFTLQNPEPGNLELRISWSQPSAQVSAYAVTYGHSLVGPVQPIVSGFEQTDFLVNAGRFLNRSRALVE